MTPNEEGPIRIRDEQQQLVGAGYQWQEERPIVTPGIWLFMCFWVLCVIVFFGDVLSLFFDQRPHILVGVVIGILLGLAPSLFIFIVSKTFPVAWDRLAHRPRAVVFYSSGKIFFQYGRPYRRYFAGTKPLLFQIETPITSIQSSDAGRMWPVNIYFADGNRLLVSVTCDYDESRVLAVELTRAHEELKTERQRAPATSDQIIN